ncbi:hypothetical protein FN846DRAFT_697994 [Sphaerosporella brunnea]|uniref:Uncharacterized protein n=1 Tax=Sphaerosporella brunnea TaxID=1250544 RepID=A0A5J5EYM2_9PEZI|nr:hypothetical protein FN846DRAFT_697994 [Sphaerosporella brunnea]
MARAAVAFGFQIHQSQLQILDLLFQLRLLLVQHDIAFAFGCDIALSFRCQCLRSAHLLHRSCGYVFLPRECSLEIQQLSIHAGSVTHGRTLTISKVFQPLRRLGKPLLQATLLLLQEISVGDDFVHVGAKAANLSKQGHDATLGLVVGGHRFVMGLSKVLELNFET